MTFASGLLRGESELRSVQIAFSRFSRPALLSIYVSKQQNEVRACGHRSLCPASRRTNVRFFPPRARARFSSSFVRTRRRRRRRKQRSICECVIVPIIIHSFSQSFLFFLFLLSPHSEARVLKVRLLHIDIDIYIYMNAIIKPSLFSSFQERKKIA